MNKLQGIICVSVTPFKPDESVDYEAIKFNVEKILNTNIGGILVNGGTGEYVSLTETERFNIAELVVKTVNGKVPVAVGVSAEATSQAIKYAKHAESIGADGLMMSPPYYCKPDWEMTYSHYKAVCSSVKLPFIVYNNPGTTGVDITKDQIVQLLNEIENIVYIKDSTGSIQRSRDIKIDAPGKTVMLCGWEDLALEAAVAGATGWISVMANFAPEICIDLYTKTAQKDWEGAIAVYDKMLPMLSLLENVGPRLCQTAKHAMNLVGFRGGYNRSPRLELSESEKAIIEQEVRRSGLIH